MPATTLTLATLPSTTDLLLGREAELARLDAAWADPGCTVLTILGEDGLGKSALVNAWLARKLPSLPNTVRVYGWSFFSQGTGANQTVSADFFFDDALRRFGDKYPSRGAAWDKGRRLAELLRKQRTLLVLDGLELMQTPDGPDAGAIKDPALYTLLDELVKENPGLCILTSRLPVTNLPALDRPPAATLPLEPLPDEAGAALLRAHGLSADETRLRQVSREFQGDPLALTLLAGFVQTALSGDLERLESAIPLPEGEARGRQARRVLAAFEAHLAGSPELNLLYILGLYLRPADRYSMEVLTRTPPAIPGLTEAFFHISEERVLGLIPSRKARPRRYEVWEQAVDRLRQANLLLPPATTAEDEGEPPLDTHPLVRRYFALRLADRFPRAWVQGHQRLYKYYKAVTEQYPDTLAELTPLYHALAHGCRAGEAQYVMEEIYWERIARQQEFYTARVLGAYGADLAALANLFRKPWQEPSPTLPKVNQATALSWTASALRALGRLDEARQVLEAAIKLYAGKKKWKEVSIAAGQLSQLCLLLGDIPSAVAQAQDSVARARSARDQVQQMIAHAGLGDALHQAGQLEEARSAFAEAEKRQRRLQIDHPVLYSRRGYQYCDLLLTLGEFEEARQRAERTLEIARANKWTQDAALDRLTMGRALLAAAKAEDGPVDAPRLVLSASARQAHKRGLDAAGQHLHQAVKTLRQEGAVELLPPALLARAEWHRLLGRWAEAQADIDEAQSAADRVGMKIFQADARLAQAALLAAQGQTAAARSILAAVREMVEAFGYHRRDREVSALEAA
ncbi:MAG: hypothetical protein D6784_00275, partial [Chloroflexi bacterium]